MKRSSAIGFLSALILVLVGCGSSTDPISLAQASVREQLKNGESARFEKTAVLDSKDASSKYRSLKYVCGEVNSKNSFGAYAGSVRYVVLLGAPSGQAKLQVLTTDMERTSGDAVFTASFWSANCTGRT